MQKFAFFYTKIHFSQKLVEFAQEKQTKIPAKCKLAHRGDLVKRAGLFLFIIEKTETVHICSGINQHISHLIVF